MIMSNVSRETGVNEMKTPPPPVTPGAVRLIVTDGKYWGATEVTEEAMQAYYGGQLEALRRAYLEMKLAREERRPW
jgi:hypothetical protein